MILRQAIGRSLRKGSNIKRRFGRFCCINEKHLFYFTFLKLARVLWLVCIKTPFIRLDRPVEVVLLDASYR